MAGPVTSSNMPINTIDPVTAKYMQKYASAGLPQALGGNLPKSYDITQQQLNNAATGKTSTDIPTNAVDLETLKTLEKTNPKLAERIRKNAGALPVNTTGKALEVQAMGTKGPDTYNKAQGLIKDAQDKAGITQSTDFNIAKREQEKAARDLNNVKGFTHIAKYTPNQDPAAVKDGEKKVEEAKAAVDEPKEEPKDKGVGTDTESDTQETTGNLEDSTQESDTGDKDTGTFERDTNAMLRGRPAGNLHDVNASTAKAQAQDARNAGANREMEAQASQQIANQNPYVEAGKTAAIQNDAQNRQNVKKAGVLGAGAALARTTTNPDVTAEKARVDTQRTAAAQQREKADEMRQWATTHEGQANMYNMMSRDVDNATDMNAEYNSGTEKNGQGFVNTAKNAWQNIQDIWNRNKNPADIESDSRVKNIHGLLERKFNNTRMDWIRDDYDKFGGPRSFEDLEWLLSKAGKLNYNGQEYDLTNDDGWDETNLNDDVLGAYADHIRNYVYNYKPEACDI